MKWINRFCFSCMLAVAVTSACFFVAEAQTTPTYAHVRFNKLMEVSGTPYVIASKQYLDKVYNQKSNFLLFINTQNGESTKVSFADDAEINEHLEVRIDSLGIHILLLSGRTKNLNNNKSIDWGDPAQLFILSTDGKQQTQLTADSFYVQRWEVNRHTGRLMVTGFYDVNGNYKYDLGDVNEIQTFDLRTLKLVFRM